MCMCVTGTGDVCQLSSGPQNIFKLSGGPEYCCVLRREWDSSTYVQEGPRIPDGSVGRVDVLLLADQTTCCLYFREGHSVSAMQWAQDTYCLLFVPKHQRL